MRTISAVAVAGAIAFASHAVEWIAGAYSPPSESDSAAFFAPARNDVVEREFRTRRLAPGKEFDPHGTAWMLCIGGTGGRDGWERQVNELGE